MKIISNCEIATFSEVAQIVTGNTPARDKSEYYDYKGIPWVKITDLGKGEVYTASEYLTLEGAKYAHVVPENAVMVSCVGTIGKVGIAATEVATNQQITSLIFDENKILPKYGYYYCISIEEYLKSIAKRSVLSIINKAEFSNIKIPVPPLNEQAYISSVLEMADRLLAMKRDANSKLVRYVDALFFKMFGNPDVKGFKYDFVLLGDFLLSTPQNGVYKHKSFYGHGNRIIRIKDIKDGCINNIESLDQVHLKADEVTKYSLKRGEILINRVNSIENLGKCAIVKNLEEDVVFESNIMRLSVNTEIIRPEFLAIWLSTDFIKNYIKNRAKISINQSSINQKDVMEMIVPVVPLGEQNIFVKMLEEYTVIKDNLNFTTQKAEQAFKAILEKAFTGGIHSYKHQNNETLNNLAELEKTKTFLQINTNHTNFGQIYYNRDFHYLEIDNMKYFSRNGLLEEPIEVQKKALKKLRMRDLPRGVSVKKLKEVISYGDDYGSLQYVSVGCDEDGNYFGNTYLPVELIEGQKPETGVGEMLIYGELEDYVYIKSPSKIKFSDTAPVLTAIVAVQQELRKKTIKEVYNRYRNYPQNLKSIIELLSKMQRGMFEEFLISHDYMAVHVAVKRLNSRISDAKVKSFGVQEGIQTVELLEGLGLLTKMPEVKMHYKKLPFDEQLRTIESDYKEEINIDLWCWNRITEG